MSTKYAQYFAIEKRILKEGYLVTREQLISEFSDNRKKRLTQLSEFEYLFFIQWLLQNYPAPFKGTKPMTAEEVKSEIKRKKVISLFRQIGYNENGQADMERIYAWVIKYGRLKKPLMDYSSRELDDLITQVEQYYKSTLL